MDNRSSDGVNRPAPWDYPLGSPESRAAARMLGVGFDPELEALRAQPGVTWAARCGDLIFVVERIGWRREDGEATEQQPGKDSFAG